MDRKIRERHISGVTTEEVREYETRHREVARRAAADGMVLLKNENEILPFAKGQKIALYGGGAIHMIKGGTGSGDVNHRELVEIREGMINAGFDVTDSDWLDAYERIYDEEKLKWRDDLLARSHEPGGNLFELYAGNPMQPPYGPDPVKTDADVAVYILTRVSGEGADRTNTSGDFKISDDERRFLGELNRLYDHIVLVINAGGLINLDKTDDLDAIDAIIYMMQPGMEGGNALADIMSGRVTPSGKLTDSWAYKYRDYPSSKTFSKKDGNTEFEEYAEGIYVGYRYFDTFGKAVRYCFGFGLSYTKFKISTEKMEITSVRKGEPEINITVEVTNTGDKYSGREVVQIYVSCPDGKLEKEYRRLCAFAKTDVLAPGESCRMKLNFPVSACASYDEKIPGYFLEDGYYGIWVGSSLGDSRLRGMVKLDNSVVAFRTKNICPVKDEFTEMSCGQGLRAEKYHSWIEKGKSSNVPILLLNADNIKTVETEYGVRSKVTDPEAMQFTESLSADELIMLATGDPGKRENGGMDFLGAGGVSVPGSAAETNRSLVNKGLASMVLSDGPAGLRLDKGYTVTADGLIERKEFIDSIENGIFSEKERVHRDGDVIYHQYCTAFPIGTLLAQTWDTELVSEVGRAVAEEMMEFQTSLWLAPGMNIHRNPLCGRNFEYYSEDPLVSGMIAAAMTKGVQSVGGCGTTIKHFACNNQEENRLACDSRVHERALREIYLKGFEICVRSSQPMAMMTSYNLVNGVHSANSYDLCSAVARDEWGFKGLIMTDWTTTEQGPDCTAAGCMRAGNDLVCPGCDGDHENIREELGNGSLELDDLKACIARQVYVIWRSNAYEDAIPYTEEFTDLYHFMSTEKNI